MKRQQEEKTDAKQRILDVEEKKELELKFQRELEEGLDGDQLRALHLVQTRNNVFITGPGGSGKSHLLRVLKRWAAHKKLCFDVTATTGVSALNVGGITIHSWAGVGYGKESVDFLLSRIRSSGKNKKSRYGSAINRWTKTHILFIDEISMLSSSLFSKLEQIGRILRNRPLRAFGGLQLVVCGDFLQLPPVDRDIPPAKNYYHHHHHHKLQQQQQQEQDTGKTEKHEEKCGDKYLFLSESWNRTMGAVVLLRRAYRQNDNAFISLLGRARLGELSNDDIELLMGRIQEDPNKRVKDANGIEAPLLHPFKKAVEDENMRCLDELPGICYVTNRRSNYVHIRKQPSLANIVVMEKIVNADMEVQIAAKKLEETITAGKQFVFKIGAVVMLLTNLDVRNRLVNGIRGTIIAIGPNPPQPAAAAAAAVAAAGVEAQQIPMEVEVMLSAEEEERKMREWRKALRKRQDADEDGDEDGGIEPTADEDPLRTTLEGEDEKIWIRFEGVAEPTPISRHRWKHCLRDSERNLPEEEWSEYVQVSQFPLTLAYASTIHKTQSLELTAGILSLGSEIKSAGQAYTALSRIKSLNGLFLSSFSPKSVFADLITKHYYEILLQAAPTTTN